MKKSGKWPRIWLSKYVMNYIKPIQTKPYIFKTHSNSSRTKKNNNFSQIYIWVFPKTVVPPESSTLIGFSIIFTIHFRGFSPYFGKHPKHPYGSPADQTVAVRSHDSLDNTKLPISLGSSPHWSGRRSSSALPQPSSGRPTTRMKTRGKFAPI